MKGTINQYRIVSSLSDLIWNTHFPGRTCIPRGRLQQIVHVFALYLGLIGTQLAIFAAYIVEMKLSWLVDNFLVYGLATPSWVHQL